MGKTAVMLYCTARSRNVYQLIEQWWSTLPDSFGEFNGAEWDPLFTVSRLKAAFLIIKQKNGMGLLALNEGSYVAFAGFFV